MRFRLAWRRDLDQADRDRARTLDELQATAEIEKQRIADLRAAKDRIDGMERDLKQAADDLRGSQHEKQLERIQRASAQRGLVPYVRGLEAFSDWLRERPELSRQIEAPLRANGLWDIKLGYDPDKDITLSVVSPERFA